MSPVAKSNLISTQLIVTGIIQGVGFRPFVFRLAKQLQLTGSVKNLGGSVEIEIAGPEKIVEEFMFRLEREAPQAARIERVWMVHRVDVDEPPQSFEIVESEQGESSIEVSPDIATCRFCLQELFCESDRRFGYPFLNCTNCGPRFTIIESLPYDRTATVMRAFDMCAACREEYADPSDRRFHAQPTACANCGPKLSFSPDGSRITATEDDSLARARALLLNGGILALKGLGGFHLACLATDCGVIERLRRLKDRPAKPFAVMMADLAMVNEYCKPSKFETSLLTSSAAPIVLLCDSGEKKLADAVAPGLSVTGVMLPYTPLHHLLLSGIEMPLVMTSGNHSEEPIAISNEEAFDRLKQIADGFLVHDREILTRYDDSVVSSIEDRKLSLRRSRGYAPAAYKLNFQSDTQVLALGGHLKSTFCFIKDTRAYMSQHIGDLDNLESRDHYTSILGLYGHLFELTPRIVALDMHPDYATSAMLDNWLEDSVTSAPFDVDEVRETVYVQHHHAHIASCMVEHRLSQPVIGVAFDGIGYGTDNTLWGGEFLRCTLDSFERLGHFETLPMPGGVAAIRSPWRMALAFSERMPASEGKRLIADILSKQVDEKTIDSVLKQLHRKLNCPMTSSSGRIFDAVSSALGLAQTTSYEGEAALLLESRATSYSDTLDCQSFTYRIIEQDGNYLISVVETLEQLLRLKYSGASIEELAYRFHITVAEIIEDMCRRIRRETGINQVCLSGGVFQNKLLLKHSFYRLHRRDFEVFTPEEFPANDGGLALGQAAIALASKGLLEHSH